MSNVEYRCPECGNRLFAPAGGTNIKCHRHPEQVYVQTEAYVGPNFAFKDEGDNDPNKTGVATFETQNIKPVNVQVDTSMSESEQRAFLREQYRRVSGGQKPDFRWGINRLKEEIEAWENFDPAAEEDGGEEAEVEIEDEVTNEEPAEVEAEEEEAESTPDPDDAGEASSELEDANA